MRHARRRGFTLIELLVVIGIIMILVGLLIAGYRHLNAATAQRETSTELKLCKGLLVDYENKAGGTWGGLSGIEAFGNPMPLPLQSNDSASPNPSLFPVHVDPPQTSPPTAWYAMTYTYPPSPVGTYWPVVDTSEVSVTSGSSTNADMGDKSGGGPRYGTAVGKTADVMYVLNHVPSNRTTMQSLQTKRTLEVPPGGWKNSAGTVINLTAAVPLDGWGNPIVFVPRGGLHVNIKDPTNPSGPTKPYVVRSTGTLPIVGTKDPPLNGRERPFFASAGQDGDFTQGEDNVYSFQD